MNEMDAVSERVNALEARLKEAEEAIARERIRHNSNMTEFARVITEVAAAAGIRLELEQGSTSAPKE